MNLFFASFWEQYSSICMPYIWEQYSSVCMPYMTTLWETEKIGNSQNHLFFYFIFLYIYIYIFNSPKFDIAPRKIIYKWTREYLFTWVCVRPREAANSARSGKAKYCVRWKRLFSCWSCRLEYIVRGLRIFLPLPLILNCSSIWDFSVGK